MTADYEVTVEEQAEARALVSYRKKVGRHAPVPTGANAGKASQRWFETLKAEACDEIIRENADRAMGIVRGPRQARTLRQRLRAMLGKIRGKRD